MRIIEQLVYKITGDTSDFNKNIDSSSKKTKGFDLVLKGLTAGAIAVAIKKFASLVSETNKYLDSIDKMSQKIGISRQAYQEWDFILSQNGASVDGLQTGLKTLSTAVDEANQGTKEYAEVFERLNVSVTDSNGNLKDQEMIFNEVFIALSDVENETERTALATRLLGRSATELSPAMNSGSEAIEEMRGKAKELGLVLEDDVVDAGVKLTDNIDQIERAFKSWRTNALAPVIIGLASLTDKIIGNYSSAEELGIITGSLTKNSNEYKKVLQALKTPTENQTEAEKNLLIARKASLEFEAKRTMLELGRVYSNTVSEIESLEKKQEGYNNSIDRASSYLSQYTEEQKNEIRSYQQQGSVVTEMTHKKRLLLLAESELRDSQIGLLNTQIELDEKNGDFNASLALVSQAVIDGQISIKEIANINRDFATSVENNVAVLEEQKKAQEDSTEAVVEETEAVVEETEAEKARNEILSNSAEALKNAELYSLALGDSYDLNAQKASILESTIKALIDTGLSPESDAVAELIGLLNDLVDSEEEVIESTDEATESTEKLSLAQWEAQQAFIGASDARERALATSHEYKGAIDEEASALEKLSEKLKKYEEDIGYATQGVNMLSDTWGYFNEVRANQNAEELARLEAQGVSEEELNAKKTEMAREEAQRSKSQATFQAIIDTASAIIGFLAEAPFPANIALSAAAGITGAAQIAAIQSEPLPSFDVGSIRIPSDTSAIVHKDEMILPAPIAEQARQEGVSISPSGGAAGGNTTLVVYLDGQKIAENTVGKINSGRVNTINPRVIK